MFGFTSALRLKTHCLWQIRQPLENKAVYCFKNKNNLKYTYYMLLYKTILDYYYWTIATNQKIQHTLAHCAYAHYWWYCW